MNTVEDFKNAPIGAIAINDSGIRAVKKTDDGEWCWLTPKGSYLSDDGVAYWEYKLYLPVPTSAREALDLAWELAHEVKEGQVIPKGVRLLDRFDSNDFSVYTTLVDFTINAREALSIRTLEPLPNPEPDWLDAPAVIAWSRWDDLRREKVWTKADECYKSTDSEIIDWSGLCDVTPLYPKGQSGLNPSKSRGIEHEEYRPLLEKAWDEGFADGVNHDLGDWENAPSAINNPYRQETDA